MDLFDYTKGQLDLFGYQINQPVIFSGSDYDPKEDNDRLTGQILRIYELMKDGLWRTLEEINLQTHDHEASISAQLRNLRKARFGSHIIERRSRGDRSSGLFEYRLNIPLDLPLMERDHERL